MPQYQYKTPYQSGRSMIEMLGVLAIVGILSVGALAGYSMAMTSHKANAAINEISNDILAVLDLFANKNNFSALPDSTDQITYLLEKAGIFTNVTDWYEVNTSGKVSYLYKESNHVIVYRYSFSKNNKSFCSKLLLADWRTKIGNSLRQIQIYNGSYVSYSYQTEITVDDMASACTDDATAFLIKISSAL